MYFLTDYNRKVCFGWSAKCGCSSLKKIFFNLTNQNKEPYCVEHKLTHCPCTYKFNKIPENYQDFTFFIIVRNPYDRIVSGMLEKWNNGTDNKLITFSSFVDELITNKFQNIDDHHFTNQFSESWSNELLTLDKIHFMDLYKINYELIESFYETTIPDKLKNPSNIRKKKLAKQQTTEIYNVPVDEIKNYEYQYKDFYNSDLQIKIEKFYELDFEILKSIGFSYYLNLK